MARFILRRLSYNVLVLVGVLFLVHGLLLATGDPAASLLPIDAGQEAIDNIRDKHGLNDPLPVQFVKFVGRVAQGDFGDSWQHSRPALDLILERAPASLRLGLVGLGLALAVGTPLGALAAIKKGTWIDQAARFVAVLGQATPGFWLGIMLLLILGVRLELLPISGAGDWRHLVMPGIVIALPTIPSIVRIFRSSLIGVLERDYVRTARAKGLGGLRVFRRHVTRNASIPVITVISFEVGAILSGALIAEVIFAYPGVGRLAYIAILGRDLALVQAYVVVVSLVVLTTNMLLDLTYALIDPRVRVR